jgi:hypothetical protein
MAASISDKMVLNISSSTWLCPRTFLKHRLVVPTMRSHHPPHQAARGAMNFQVIPLLPKNCDVLGEARMGKTSFNSCILLGMSWHCLSRLYVEVLCGLQICNPMRNLSTDMSDERSKCKDLVVAHVNSKMYTLLTVLDFLV